MKDSIHLDKQLDITLNTNSNRNLHKFQFLLSKWICINWIVDQFPLTRKSFLLWIKPKTCKGLVSIECHFNIVKTLYPMVMAKCQSCKKQQNEDWLEGRILWSIKAVWMAYGSSTALSASHNRRTLWSHEIWVFVSKKMANNVVK